MDQRTVDPAATEAEVDQIRSLGIDALRERWRMMFGATPPPLGRPEAMAISDKERCSNLLIREQRIIPDWGASRSASAVSAQ